mmetsp:Transcript_26599/g.52421  ORF Transcript_26599/g.52421 Transcript_26599/m.52421 type:complete len:240 (-) Transcript_26599:66-785(-)
MSGDQKECISQVAGLLEPSSRDSLKACFGESQVESVFALMLKSRKNDLESSAARLTKLAALVKDYDLQVCKATSEMEQVFKLKVLQVAPDQRSLQGNPVVVIRPHNLDWGVITVDQFIKAWFFAIWNNVVVSGNELAQTSGVVLCGNMSKISRKNFSREAIRFIMNALQNVLPIKVKQITAYKPPWVFYHVLFPIVQLFMKKKMRDRMVFINSSDFSKQPEEQRQYAKFFVEEGDPVSS